MLSYQQNVRTGRTETEETRQRIHSDATRRQVRGIGGQAREAGLAALSGEASTRRTPASSRWARRRERRTYRRDRGCRSESPHAQPCRRTAGHRGHRPTIVRSWVGQDRGSMGKRLDHRHVQSGRAACSHRSPRTNFQSCSNVTGMPHEIRALSHAEGLCDAPEWLVARATVSPLDRWARLHLRRPRSLRPPRGRGPRGTARPRSAPPGAAGHWSRPVEPAQASRVPVRSG